MPAKAEPKTIVIPPPSDETCYVRIQGLTPLICDRIDPAEIDEPKNVKSKATIKPKDKDKLTPEQAFRKKLYVMDESLPDDHPDKYGFPGAAFLRAMTYATTLVPGREMNKTNAPVLLSVPAELVKLDWEAPPHLRTDTPRNKQGGVIKVYRAQFDNWACTVPIEYISESISIDMVYNLMCLAGKYVGIGNMRKQLGHDFGKWEVVQIAEREEDITTERVEAIAAG